MIGLRSPVIVTGLPRSGTTWLGRTLTLSGELGELYEPFNPSSRQARWFEPPHFYLHVDETNDAAFTSPIEEMAALRYPLGSRLRQARSAGDARAAVATWRRVRRYRRDGRRPLVKDPIALFATEWLHGRFGFRPVIVLRHPCGFVSSLARVGWEISFQSWLQQPRLMTTLLAPWQDEIEEAAARDPDPVADAATFWAVCTGVIAAYRERHPDWIVVRHEDLALDPEAQFEALYQRLGLSWTDALAREVHAATSSDNPAEAAAGQQHDLARDSRAVAEIWRTRLREDQVATVRRLTLEVATRFYPDETWD